MLQLSIKAHKFLDVNFMRAKWQGRTIEPTALIFHDTASRLSSFSAAQYLADNDAKVSVHLTVERDGIITQHVAFNKRANHAGRSSLNGRDWCNNFTIGVEVVNPGRMTSSGRGQARAWFGKMFDVDEHDVERIETPQHGDGWWMPYTEEQIGACEAIAVALLAKYKKIREIQTHWYISPGRKVDTNPLFPIEAIRTRAMGREDFALDDADEMSEPVQAASDGNMMRVETFGDALNMRRWPSFNPNVIVSIPDGTMVPVIRAGKFDGRDWSKVVYAGQQGWVVDRYLRPA